MRKIARVVCIILSLNMLVGCTNNGNKDLEAQLLLQQQQIEELTKLVENKVEATDEVSIKDSDQETIAPIEVENESESTTHTELYTAIREKALFTGELRDNKGISYEVYLYADNGKLENASFANNTVWAGANEGDQLYTGLFKIAYRDKKSGEINEISIDSVERTLNLSRQLVSVVANKFDTKNDLLLFGEAAASDSICLNLFHIVDGVMQPLDIEADGNLYSYIYTQGTMKPFFNQTAIDTFEVAIYDNAETCRYYIYPFTMINNHTLKDTGRSYSMEISEFKAYLQAIESGTEIKTDRPVVQPNNQALATLGLEISNVEFDIMNASQDTVRIHFVITNNVDKIINVYRSDFIIKLAGDNAVEARKDSGGFDRVPMSESPIYIDDSVKLYPQDSIRVSLDFRVGKTVQFNSGYKWYFTKNNQLIEIQAF